MIVHINDCEWYPVFDFDEDFGYRCRITKEKFERWRKVTQEFKEVQSEMMECASGKKWEVVK